MISPLAAESSGGNPLSSLLFLAVLGALFYFVAIRPNRRRMRVMQQVQSALAPGREVVTTAGLYATVVSMDGDTVHLEVAPGVVSRYARAAIVRVVDEAAAEPAPPADEPAEI